MRNAAGVVTRCTAIMSVALVVTSSLFQIDSGTTSLITHSRSKTIAIDRGPPMRSMPVISNVSRSFTSSDCLWRLTCSEAAILGFPEGFDHLQYTSPTPSCFDSGSHLIILK